MSVVCVSACVHNSLPSRVTTPTKPPRQHLQPQIGELLRLQKIKSYLTSRKQRLGNGNSMANGNSDTADRLCKNFNCFVQISNTFFVDAVRVHMHMAEIRCVRKVIKINKKKTINLK